MDRKTLLAITLCFIIFVVWQNYFMPKPNPPAAPLQTQSENAQQPVQRSKENTQISENKTPLDPKVVHIKNATVTLSNGPTFFKDWSLDNYNKSKDSKEKVDLEWVSNQDRHLAFGFDSQDFAYLGLANGEWQSVSDQQAVWVYEDKNIRLERIYNTNNEEAFIDVVVKAQFKNTSPKNAFLSLSAQPKTDDDQAIDRKYGYWVLDSIETESLDKVELASIQGPVKWISNMSRYFTFAVISQPALQANVLFQPLSYGKSRISLSYPVSGSSLEIPVRVYFGAKELNVLKRVEPTLESNVDFGFFTFVAHPLLKIMKWFYTFVNNWGVAIILLTALVKLLTLPLTYKSMKSMKKMAKYTPELKKLQEKYKGDREALNREMLTFMKTHGYNPMAGCWPMLIQMPIFFALYRVLYSSVELYQAPFAFWIHDLSVKDPFYVMPVLVSVTWFLQQKLTPQPATMDPMQRKIMQFMPIMFGLFMLTLPAGLGIYFLVNAVLSIFQQLVLNKKFEKEENASLINDGAKA